MFPKTLAEWYDGGRRVALTLPVHLDVGRTVQCEIFYRTFGNSGPWLTFLHGFPSSSLDWARVAEALQNGYRVLVFDFLGFGGSSKPSGHPYSLIEQTEITGRLWLHLGITETVLVAHDYGVSVAQEFLSRQLANRQSEADIKKVIFLNGGLYRRLVKPFAVQKLLRQPVIGSLVAQLSSGGLFKRNLRALLAAENRNISDAELDLHWQAMKREGGHKQMARLIHYMTERDQHGDRWEDALENAPVPVAFIWGTQDPISGPLLPRLRNHFAASDIHELPDAGHYPQWEKPAQVAELIDFICSMERTP